MQLDLSDLLKSLEYKHLYEVHPHFDSYPAYLQQALLTNERLQGRIKDKRK
jgi:hypothetical protein